MNSKVVMITGGAKGIGKACAEAFLQEGGQVSIMSRTAKELESTQRELDSRFPKKVLTFKGSVTESTDIDQWFKMTIEQFGAPSVLINNAAIFTSQLVTAQSKSDWEKVIEINLTGSFLCSQAFFRVHSSQATRSIINISSLAGIRGTEKFPGLSSYVASKFGIIGLTEALAVEGKPLNIRVNCIAPGAVDTEMLRRALPNLKAQAEPKDIAQICVYLADESRARVLTGTTIEVFSNN